MKYIISIAVKTIFIYILNFGVSLSLWQAFAVEPEVLNQQSYDEAIRKVESSFIRSFRNEITTHKLQGPGEQANGKTYRFVAKCITSAIQDNSELKNALKYCQDQNQKIIKGIETGLAKIKTLKPSTGEEREKLEALKKEVPEKGKILASRKVLDAVLVKMTSDDFKFSKDLQGSFDKLSRKTRYFAEQLAGCDSRERHQGSVGKFAQTGRSVADKRKLYAQSRKKDPKVFPVTTY